jgi:hypothetical protein
MGMYPRVQYDSELEGHKGKTLELVGARSEEHLRRAARNADEMEKDSSENNSQRDADEMEKDTDSRKNAIIMDE